MNIVKESIVLACVKCVAFFLLFFSSVCARVLFDSHVQSRMQTHTHTPDNLAFRSLCSICFFFVCSFSRLTVYSLADTVRIISVPSSTPHTIGCDIQVEHLVFICYRHHIDGVEEEPTISFLNCFVTTAERRFSTVFFFLLLLFRIVIFLIHLWNFTQIETRRTGEWSNRSSIVVFS